MPETNKSHRRTREEIARSAAMGPNRAHGEVPPKDIEIRRDASYRAVRDNGGAGTREHTATPTVEVLPKFTARRIAAGVTAGALVLGAGEVTNYGDSVPIVSQVKDAATWVVEQVDNGPSNPEVVNDSWLSSQNIISNLGIDIQSNLARTSLPNDVYHNQEP